MVVYPFHLSCISPSLKFRNTSNPQILFFFLEFFIICIIPSSGLWKFIIINPSKSTTLQHCDLSRCIPWTHLSTTIHMKEKTMVSPFVTRRKLKIPELSCHSFASNLWFVNRYFNSKHYFDWSMLIQSWSWSFFDFWLTMDWTKRFLIFFLPSFFF